MNEYSFSEEWMDMSNRILSSSPSGKHSSATSTAATSTGSLADATQPTSRPGRRDWGQAIMVAVLAAAIVSVVLLAFSWPTMTSEPKDLPIATVGSQQLIDQAAENAPEGMLDLKTADSREEAVDMIREREVYGALILGDSPEILTASAASPAVAGQLRTMASQIQQKIDDQAISGLKEGLSSMQKALEAAANPPTGDSPSDTPGDSPGQGSEKAQQPPQAAEAGEIPTVTVTDVVPLSDDDSTGAGLAIAGLPLTIGGIIGGVLISLLVRSRRMRALSVLVYGAVGGIALALILQSGFGILQGNFGLNALAAGLAVGSTAGIINGFVSLVGPAGIGIGAILTMFIGNPISSLNSPKEFLAWHWGDIGQYFVPGASGTLLRDLSYFPDASMAMQWWVLILWLVAGLALMITGHLVALARAKSQVSATAAA